MWRLVLFLLVVQQSFISSEPAGKENLRESRQLNFGDCCPCPGAEAYNGQSAPNSRMASNDVCPCLTSDSQPESSVFSPAFKAVESFMRPGAKKEPKPLLQPEVGLASSVLETLHEVTEQEYQEALARDAAKNFLKVVEPDTPSSESRNVINIILSPKGDYNKDLMSEATHVKETRCIPPNLGVANSFPPLKLRSPVNVMQDILDTPKHGSNSLLHRRLYDMDGSASNLQESVIHPIKNNLFDDLKTKSNLLKLKLFSNALKNSPFTNNFRNANQGYGNSNRNWQDSDYNTQVSNTKLPPILDQLQKPAHDNTLDIMPSQMRTNDEESENCLSTTNNTEIKNNLNQHSQLRNQINPVIDNNDQSNLGFSNEVSVPRARYQQDHQITNIDHGNIVITKPEPKAVVDDQNLVPKTDLTLDKDIQAMKASPSDILEVSDPDISKENKGFLEDNIGNQNFSEKKVKDTESHNKIMESEEGDVSSSPQEIMKNALSEEKKTSFKYGNDMKSDASFDNIKTTTLGLMNKECVNSLEYDKEARSSPNNEAEDQLENLNILPFPIDKDLVETSISTTQKTDILPNIKADILATLENFKKANEIIHEKLRSNVQDALQSAPLRSVPLTGPNQPFVIPSSTEMSEKQTNEANISTQDLQEMSDLLLHLSKLKNETEPSLLNNEQIVSKKLENKQIDSNEIAGDTDIPEENIEIQSSSKVNSKSNTESESIDNNKKANDIEENKCDNNVIPKSAPSSGALNNGEKEMIAQASNSVSSRIPHPGLNLAKEDYRIDQSDFNTNGNPMGNVKDFFNNIRSSVKDMFQTNKGFVTYKNNPDDESNTPIRDCIFKNAIENDPQHHDFTLNDDGEYDDTRTLNSYKARVASPTLLNRSPSFARYTSPGEESDTLSAASQRLLSQNLRWPVEIPRGYNFKSPGTKYLKEAFSDPYIPKPSIFQDILPTKAVVSLGENLRSRTEDSLKTIHDYLGATFMDPLKLKESNTLSQSILNRNNLLEPLLKPYEKVATRRPTSLNTRIPLKSYQPRIPTKISDFSDRNEFNKRLLNNVANIFKNMEYEKSNQFKETPFKRNQAAVPLNKKLKSISPPTPKLTESTPNRLKNIDRLNIKQKGRLSPPQTNLESNKLNIKTKTPVKNNIKVKPLKESKVTISFTTSMRPDTLKTSLKSQIEKGLVKSKSSPLTRYPPKISKNVLEKKTNIKSKLKSSEPQTLASENFISQIPADTSIDKPTYTQWVSADEALESSQNSNQDEFKYADDSYKSNIQELPKDMNKINALRYLNSNRKIPKNHFFKMSKNGQPNDTTHSASNNVIVSAPTPLDSSLKENVSYKCKMVCVKDILDTTDTPSKK